ncbi:MAG: WcaI family glycosyltransferase [Cyanobacteria bacterium P01_F01_bin.153]
MKILIYSYNYHPEPIGIAPLMTELAEGLAARGHQVRVLTGMPNYPQRRIYEGYRGKVYMTEHRNGVRVDRCYVWIRPKPGLVTRMALDGSFVFTSFARSLFGWRPDIILFASPPLPVSIPAWLLGKLKGCPVVLNLQDILPEAAVHTGLIRNEKAIKIFEALENFAYKRATHVSVIAEGFVDNLIGKNVPEKKISLIPNWVNTNFIYPMAKHNSFREEHGLQNNFVVMYSGNIALTQGLETVVNASALLKEHPDVDNIQRQNSIKFVIVGEEKALKKLEDYCRDRQVLDYVLLLPFQPRERLPEMLAAADVGLIVQKSNVVAFNMPSKTQVLLASGRAIIASVPRSGTAARAVRSSEGGLVVEPESPQALLDAVLTLANDRDRTTTLGKYGRAYAEKTYSFESALNAYEALFEKLCHKKR